MVHVTINAELSKITLLPPVAKKDPEAGGCERSWTCLCTNGPASRPDCPYHAAVEQLSLPAETFGTPLKPRLPLFPPVVKIMVLARWTGETVLRYIREAPLAHLADEVNALEGKRNLLALSDKLADGAEKLTGKVQDLEDQLRLQRERRQATSLAASAEDPDRSGRPYVTNGAKKATKLKVHRVLISGHGTPLTSWRTVCGFRFAFSKGERSNSYKKFESSPRCKRCGLRDEIADDDEKSGSSSTSATDSSAQSSEEGATPSPQSEAAGTGDAGGV